MRLLKIKACLFIAADLLLLAQLCYLERLQPSSACIGVRVDSKMSWMWLLPTLQLKHRLLVLLASQGFSANLRGRKRKYSETWTFAFTHRHCSSVWGMVLVHLRLLMVLLLTLSLLKLIVLSLTIACITISIS